MPTSFRPRLEALDARDLPSVTPFTFALSNGTLVTGSFDYADAAVDAAQATQQIAITDVTVAVNGQAASLIQELFAPTATFELGQLQNIAFAYDLGGVDLTSVATRGGSLVAITPTGGVVSTAPPAGSPSPGDVPLDWTGAIATYNVNVVQLNAILAQIEQQMGLFDALEPELKDALIKIRFAQTPEDRVGAQMFYDAYYAKLTTHSRVIADLYGEYKDLYQSTLQQAAFLRRVVPIEQLNLMSPLPPLVSIPGRYFEPLNAV